MDELIKALKRYKKPETAYDKVKELATKHKVTQKVVKEQIDILFNTKPNLKEPVKKLKDLKVKESKPLKKKPTKAGITDTPKTIQDYIKDAELREEKMRQFNNKGFERKGVCPKCVTIIDFRVMAVSLSNEANTIINKVEALDNLKESDKNKLISQKIKEENMYDSKLIGHCSSCKCTISYTEYVGYSQL